MNTQELVGVISAGITGKWPEAVVTTERYSGSTWLNIKLRSAFFTLEARDSLAGVGFSKIEGTGVDFGGHDVAFEGTADSIAAAVVNAIQKALTPATLANPAKPLKRQAGAPASKTARKIPASA